MTLGRKQVIVYARAPRFGRGKRRLAADVGSLQALRFYRSNLGALLRRVSHPSWDLTLHMADPADVGHPFFFGYSSEPQGNGNLGARMARSFRSRPPGPVVLVGSDIPEIEQAHIHQAFAALRRHDAVFGPAEDGGYWLVGLSGRRPVPYRFMADVRWSTANALRDTQDSLPESASIALLESLPDIDTGADFQSYLERGGRCR